MTCRKMPHVMGGVDFSAMRNCTRSETPISCLSVPHESNHYGPVTGEDLYVNQRNEINAAIHPEKTTTVPNAQARPSQLRRFHRTPAGAAGGCAAVCSSINGTGSTNASGTA